MKEKKNYKVIGLIVVLILLLLWIIDSAFNLIDERFLPSIESVGKALVVITTDGYKGSTLFGHLGASFFRLFTAFFLAIATAVPLGLLSGYNKKVRAAFDPIIEFYRPLPPLAYYTLLVLWLGIGNGSKITLLYLACFAPIYIACVAAVTKVPANYINAAATLGANKKQIFMKVIFPYCLPDMFTGIRTAMGVGYSTLVAAEMVAAVSGIGWMVLDASNWLRSDIIFAGIIVMGVTGILIDAILRFIERKVVPWKGKA
ncbi:MAG: ABC transporter permease subunit [Firmicutes bacterium]|nr:ABC transporter permease subunit [Bacillota bacterium]